MRRDAGVTLMEVLIAVTLLSMLSFGMLIAIRIGLATFDKTNDKLMYNRRVAGAQRILEQQLQGLIPVVAPCAGAPGAKFGFFQGEEAAMRLVSSFSLQEAWRGQPQILEMFVVPGEKGVRLLVNEIRYTGPASAGKLCTGSSGPRFGFASMTEALSSFVLADELVFCRFSYLGPGEQRTDPGVWRPVWDKKGWPYAIRVQMAPIDPNPSRLQPISVTVPMYMHRSPDLRYVD